MTTTAGPLLLFLVGEDQFAIPLAAVAEVTAAQAPRLIPLVPLEVGGVINLRGEPLPAVDACGLLGLPRGFERRHLLVLEQGGARVGLLVGPVLRIDADFRGVGREQPGAEAGADPAVERVQTEQGTVGVVDPVALFERAVSALAGRGNEEGERCSTAF